MTDARRRFSKASLLEHLDRRITALQEKYRFDPMNGWAQVRGRGEEINREYGEYATLRDLRSRVGDHWL